jgi:hypothetical protein
MFVVARRFLYGVTKTHGGHPVSTEMVVYGIRKHVASKN